MSTENLEPEGDADHQKEVTGTPLHWAAYAGEMDAAKLLLARGAAKTAKDVKGRTPLDF